MLRRRPLGTLARSLAPSIGLAIVLAGCNQILGNPSPDADGTGGGVSAVGGETGAGGTGSGGTGSGGAPVTGGETGSGGEAESGGSDGSGGGPSAVCESACPSDEACV